MSDYLVEVSKNSGARKLISNFGIPTPQHLKRASGVWSDEPLLRRKVLVGGSGKLHPELATALLSAGAQVHVVGPMALVSLYQGPNKTRADQVFSVDVEARRPGRFDGLVFDATGLQTAEDLAQLYHFFSPKMRAIASCGRILVLGLEPKPSDSPEQVAVAHALDGFVRSIAKEIGRKGATASLLHLDPAEAGERVGPVVQFLLSERSAFISGQVLCLTGAPKKPASLPTSQVLDGKVALVTGAARGIGASTAKQLASEGARVICLDRPADEDLLTRVAGDIGANVLTVDLGTSSAPQQIYDYVKSLGTGVDVVVHNAGVTRDKTLANMDVKRWNQVIDINLKVVIETNRLLLEEGLNADGRIVCLSSVAGIAGNFGQTNYAASKSALVGYVKKLAATTADRGITVNAIAPGFIETRLTAAIPFLTREAGRRLSNLSQGGLPKDISEVVTFLVSPGAYGVSGETIRVCGGSILGA